MDMAEVKFQYDPVISAKRFKVADDYEASLLTKIALAVTGKSSVHVWAPDLYSRHFEPGVIYVELTEADNLAVDKAFTEARKVMRNEFLNRVGEFAVTAAGRRD